MNSINLPWPPRELSPNARKHWAVVAKHKKAYRQICYLMAKQAGIKSTESNKVVITFYKPSKRHMDLDNCLASMKAGLDGLADAMGVDDKHFRLTVSMAEELGGYVKVKVE